MPASVLTEFVLDPFTVVFGSDQKYTVLRFVYFQFALRFQFPDISDRIVCGYRQYLALIRRFPSAGRLRTLDDKFI